MKRIILCLGILALFLGTITASWLTPEVMNGFSGLVIHFFLGYCGIILVAQLFSAMLALRHILEEMTPKKKVSQRILLR